MNLMNNCFYRNDYTKVAITLGDKDVALLGGGTGRISHPTKGFCYFCPAKSKASSTQINLTIQQYMRLCPIKINTDFYIMK